MRLATFSFLMAALLAAAPAAIAAGTSDPSTRRVEKHHARGLDLMKKASSTPRVAARLHKLRRAAHDLQRAHHLARKLPEEAQGLATAVRGDLVRAMNSITRIHIARHSLSRAKAWNARARAVDPRSRSAMGLAREIRASEEQDLFDDLGRTGIDRVRARRAAAGLPARPRGLARRR